MNSKDKIMFAALDLFAEKGYNGVGVDQIAESVGLKGPSIYRHFKGKEDILNTLITMGETYYNERLGSDAGVNRIPESLAELKEMGLKQIGFTMHDPMVIKFRKVIAMEQFRNERFADLATKHYLTGIENMYTVIFEKMMEKEIIRLDDPRLLAMEYSAPITLLIQLCDRQPEKEQDVMERIQRHMDHFAEVYGRKLL